MRRWTVGGTWVATAVVACAAGAALAQQGEAPDYKVDAPGGKPAGAVLVWADEFEGKAPDPAKWNYDTSRNKEGWYNNELQYYSAGRPQNARVKGGVLVIEARRDDLGTRKPADWGGQRYTSARLNTAGKAAWTYGFIEVRAKLACGRGVWPAIWMMPEEPTRPWPEGGEIDIMEHVGWKPGVVHATLHTGKFNHTLKTGRGAATDVPDACGAFHRYQLDWTPERILVGIDDRTFFRVENDGSGDPGVWPFDRPMHMILNVAVGGWGGEQGVDDAAFPSRMEVDYVRVWQPPKR
jgi:beta-glucanase (GH16 family)